MWSARDLRRYVVITQWIKKFLAGTNNSDDNGCFSGVFVEEQAKEKSLRK